MTSLAAAVRSRAVAVPASVWLAALVLVSASVRIALSRGVVAPWIMVDELVYSELAKSFAAHAQLLVRDRPANGYGVVYPVLIAPAWRLHGSAPAAYEAAKVVNALAMSLAAIPAYLLARRLVSPGPALVAAILAVLVPSMLYTGELMTENAFYPLFLVVALLLVRTLERPTRLLQITLVAACLLAVATRVQALALFPAVALAPLLQALAEPRGRRSLRPFVLLYALLAATVGAALLWSLARRNSPLELLGAYRAAAHGGYTAGGALRYLVFHVAELDLYLGVLPFAALLALWSATRHSSPAVRAYAAASAALVACLVTEVAVFASQPSIARVQERNLFYVAPLALTALVALGAGAVGSPSRRTLSAAAVVAGVLPVFLPYERLFDGAAVSDTLAILPWWSLHDRVPHLPLGGIRSTALAVSLATAAFVAVPRRFALVLAAAVGGYFVAVTALAEGGRHGMRSASAAALAAGIGTARRDWVDRAVGRDADVAFLRTGSASTYAVWENELFNRSIDTIYERGGRLPGGLPETPFERGPDGVLVAGGRRLRARYALVDGALDLQGTEIAADAGPGLRLLRVDGPLTVPSEVRGLYPGDTWSGRSVVYSRLHCRGGRLEVLLESDPQLFSRAQTVIAAGAGGVATAGAGGVATARVAPTGRVLLVVPLRPVAGSCHVRFRVTRTVIPARVVPGSTDERTLGVHFLRIAYRDA